MLRTFAKVSLILAWSSKAPAEIAASHPEVRWHALPGCPSENTLKRLVEEQLGAPLDTPREQSLSGDASLSRTKQGEYRVTIATRGNGGRGRRQLSNSDCDKLTEAAALVIAIALNPKRLDSAESTPSHVSKPPSESRGKPERHTPRERDSAVAATHQPQETQLTLSGRVAHAREPLRLEARPFLGTGFLPQIDLGLMALIGYFPWRQFELRAGAAVMAPNEEPIGFAPGALSMNALALEAGACAHPLARKRQPSACLVTELAVLFAHGENLANPQRQRAAAVSFLSELEDAPGGTDSARGRVAAASDHDRSTAPISSITACSTRRVVRSTRRERIRLLAAGRAALAHQCQGCARSRRISVGHCLAERASRAIPVRVSVGRARCTQTVGVLQEPEALGRSRERRSLYAPLSGVTTLGPAPPRVSRQFICHPSFGEGSRRMTRQSKPRSSMRPRDDAVSCCSARWDSRGVSPIRF